MDAADCARIAERSNVTALFCGRIITGANGVLNVWVAPVDNPALDRSFLDRFTPALYVPGCPAHPLTFISGILDLLGIAS